MNMILFIVVITLWSFFAWEQGYKTISFSFPDLRTKKSQNKKREFQTFRYIETNHGVRCVEEQRLRCIEDQRYSII